MCRTVLSAAMGLELREASSSNMATSRLVQAVSCPTKRLTEASSFLIRKSVAMAVQFYSILEHSRLPVARSRTTKPPAIGAAWQLVPLRRPSLRAQLAVIARWETISMEQFQFVV